ncbi:outer membrane receptor for ferrienterochelin and colicins [Sphingobacterium psychroaquaticum]|uniref:Outer membrane receptor for ferrienterochelin and colicins n=2 Tax=Sphingobacterium psychroaquaticum TaxID=561061 RepID=A0A1X7HXJ8_9SPHI|nr:outer membrane receptor for ferrienterochelin and colicins [Sphingobacterium psychroaquaticum]
MVRLLATVCLFALWFPVSGQTGSLKGKVATRTGHAVPGATVTLAPDNHRIETDANGLFVFPNLYAGTYYMLVTQAGFLDASDTVAVHLGKQTFKEVVLSERARDIAEIQVTQTVIERESPDQLLRLSRSAMPMHVITRQTIEQMGSRRLDEILKEQTGIAIVSNVSGGSRSVGVQLQGFGSEYVMVLIDGQPMVGRNNGNFDLSRISVSNIERIEIIKGASSCLFGSDALGGAINIITRYGAVVPQSQLSFRYGSLSMVDATVDAEAPFMHQRGAVNVSANYYRTDGFSTTPYLQSGQSSPPYSNLDLQSRVRYQVKKNTTIGAIFRYGIRSSDMSKNWDNTWQNRDIQEERDLNFSLTLNHQFRSGIQSVSRYYLSHYNVDQVNRWEGQTANNATLKFTQQVHRYEQQFSKAYRSGLNVTGGFGGSLETMRDQAIGAIPNLTTLFGYVQGDKRFLEKLDVRGGIRYDRTSSYGGRINPSFGLQYYLHDKLSWKAGVGAGLKAPDYRMRYLVFYNPAANYLVVGNERLQETLDQMQAAGELSEVFPIVDQINKSLSLKPEKSTSYNIGTQWKPQANLTIEAGVFYHDLRHQIDPIPVATGTHIGQIYTYQNLPKSTNKGVEMNLQWQPWNALQIHVGYQYLIAKDRSVQDSIRVGNWPYNQNLHNPKTGVSVAPTVNDYWGIVNRSRHMLNARFFYRYQPWNASASLRINYRGKYPFADYNNNQFIDRYDTFVPHHLLLNAYIEKRFLKDRVTLSFTVDNILDFKHLLMPGQPGRVVIGGVSYRIQR